MRRILLALAVMALFSCMLHATEMVRVEGGTFVMGSEDGGEGEYPPHEVTLSPYMNGYGFRVARSIK